jgi:hypothetical protein
MLSPRHVASTRLRCARGSARESKSEETNPLELEESNIFLRLWH